MKSFKLHVITGLILVLAFPVGVCAMSTAEDPGEVYHPQIKATRGPVMVKGAKYSIWEPAEEGMLLLSGDIVKTEKGGFITIEFASGKIDIYETTVVVIPSIEIDNRKKDIRDVFVEEGNALFDINPLGVERGFEFRTKNVQGGVKGTVFTVSYLKDGTAVNVYRGVVQVSDLKGSSDTRVNLVAGESLRVVKTDDFNLVEKFDPDAALEDYNYNVPPGLEDNGIPADYNANPSNNGVRDRGEGEGRVK